MSSVTAVVLSWNNKTDTLRCLESLVRAEYPGLCTVLVDNASQDGTMEEVRAAFADTKVIRNSRNMGYAGGNNVGIRYAVDQGAEYILVLNNDTVLDPSCVQYLVSDMESNSDAAAAAPKSLLMDSPEVVYYAGGVISANGSLSHVGCRMHDGPEFYRSQDTWWLTGCAILFRSAALRKVGLFDPRFFLLYEDVDWSVRARRDGYRLRFVANAKLWHKVSASFGTIWNPQYAYYYTRNGLLWIERNFPMARKPRLYHAHLYRARSRATAESLEETDALLRKKAFQRGFLDYLLRRFGERRYGW